MSRDGRRLVHEIMQHERKNTSVEIKKKESRSVRERESTGEELMMMKKKKREIHTEIPRLYIHEGKIEEKSTPAAAAGIWRSPVIVYPPL